MRADDRHEEVAELAEMQHSRIGSEMSARIWSKAIHAAASARTPGLRVERAS